MSTDIKMIVTDLDGTLLRTDKTVSERVICVLHRCREAGVKVVYATGRGGSAELVAPTGLFDGKITGNGAIAEISGSIVYSRRIPHKTAQPVLTACNERGIKVGSDSGDTHYTNFVVPEIWSYITGFVITDFSQHEKDSDKIYMLNPTPEDKKFIVSMLPDTLYYVETVDTEGFLGHIMHKDATKGNAVAELARLWGISQHEIVTFGDDLNDIDMLSYAGIGVAMENALDEVKAVADVVCPSNDDDGIAVWIEANLL